MTLIRALWAIMGILIVAALLVLIFWGIPAPSTQIEKVLPNDSISSQ